MQQRDRAQHRSQFGPWTVSISAAPLIQRPGRSQARDRACYWDQGRRRPGASAWCLSRVPRPAKACRRIGHQGAAGSRCTPTRPGCSVAWRALISLAGVWPPPQICHGLGELARAAAALASRVKLSEGV